MTQGNPDSREKEKSREGNYHYLFPLRASELLIVVSLVNRQAYEVEKQVNPSYSGRF